MNAKPLQKIAIIAFAALPMMGFLRPQFGPEGPEHAPKLEAVWAQPRIGDGNLWKVYVRASDPDGDIDKIWLSFDQTGDGYSPELVIVPASQRKKLNGFVHVWAFLQGQVASLGDIYAGVEIIVEDWAGNMSEARTIEFVVVSENLKDESAPPAGFDAGARLGLIDIPLQVDPNNDDGDGDDGFDQ